MNSYQTVMLQMIDFNDQVYSQQSHSRSPSPSPSLSVSLSLSLSVSVSVCLCLSLSLAPDVFLSLSVFLSLLRQMFSDFQIWFS